MSLVEMSGQIGASLSRHMPGSFQNRTMRRMTRRSFAVCWNGLVYPVVTVAEPADLQADVRNLLKTEPVEFAVGRGERDLAPNSSSAQGLRAVDSR